MPMYRYFVNLTFHFVFVLSFWSFHDYSYLDLFSWPSPERASIIQHVMLGSFFNPQELKLLLPMIALEQSY